MAESGTRMQGFYARGGKRALDATAAALLLVVILPVVAVTALVVAGSMGRPVLFRQSRPGLHGRVFTMLKFRTMTVPDDTTHVLGDAARLTPLGRRLRALSLDELPSLWNIVRGDMSFVGPRPLLVQYLDRYTEVEARRHDVRPGLTGLAQVSGRNATTWEQRLALDVLYTHDVTLLGDLRIVARTVGVVLRAQGVSQQGEATMSEFRPRGV